MASPSITCRPTQTARAFRRYDEDDSTVLAGIDGSRAPVLRMPKLAEVHEQPLGRGLKTLRGRRTECETLDHLLESVRAGQSGALVVRGKPGIGKTALLEYAIDSASDLTVVQAAAVESEIELLVASRESNDDFAELPELVVQGLQAGDAGDLLSSVMGGRWMWTCATRRCREVPSCSPGCQLGRSTRATRMRPRRP